MSEEREDGVRGVGLLVDKDDLINYQLRINYQLLIRTFTYQPTVESVLIRPSCYQPTVDTGGSVDDS